MGGCVGGGEIGARKKGEKSSGGALVRRLRTDSFILVSQRAVDSPKQ